MSGYEDPYWSEVREEDSALERQRAEADLREWEAEQLQDRLHRDDPCRDLLGSRPKRAAA